MNISAILSSIDKSVLSEETASAIASAFETAVNEKVNARVNLEVEKAVKNLDEDHASKLKNLIEAIDKDHTEKLKQVVEAVTANHTSKLENIAKFYRKAVNEKAEKFSEKVVEEMSNYLDLYLDKIIPQEQLREAVNNTSARVQLEQIKKIVALDPSTLNEGVKKVVIQGKNVIDTLKKQLKESVEENAKLNTKIQTTQAALLLEKKTKGIPSSKKDFIVKILCDKSPEYINENFNYVVEMFEREERNVSAKLATQASKEAVTKNAKTPSLVKESTETKTQPQGLGQLNDYLGVLKSFK